MKSDDARLRALGAGVGIQFFDDLLLKNDVFQTIYMTLCFSMLYLPITNLS